MLRIDRSQFCLHWPTYHYELLDDKRKKKFCLAANERFKLTRQTHNQTKSEKEILNDVDKKGQALTWSNGSIYTVKSCA
ncbi:hypothetical protein L596_022738 [Steinernema carpocapsae]|uniref:Uncharacterized protein n=1 Tax=Steinernema carpocapsae TaxID=34508 RepID=A0A4U5MMP5_STECR|nr:hypothetical protein L596_022738 [Steinernema carpocapsae]